MPALNRIWLGIAIFAFLTSCGSYKGKSFVPHIKGYNENNNERFILNEELLEISGIVHLGGDSFASVNDEDGELFFIDIKKDTREKFRFKGKGDYEDLAKVDSTFFILESDGNIIEVLPPYDRHNTYKFTGKDMEFESLVYYQKENKLVMITKDQKHKSKGITAISFDLAKKDYDPEPYFNISLKEVYTILTNYNTECKPSGAAINPMDQKLYIVASVGKVLLQCTKMGKLEKIYKINPAQFSQPEGITFATNGDMYISNEGADGKATILKFPYVGQK
ncbi:MAG TPA: hypothetical protein VM101_10055 [Flavitalea sp.]|nr:hypothetical protein [Flavitalea sp.]